jgi:hypothetical protein
VKPDKENELLGSPYTNKFVPCLRISMEGCQAGTRGSIRCPIIASGRIKLARESLIAARLVVHVQNTKHHPFRRHRFSCIRESKLRGVYHLPVS